MDLGNTLTRIQSDAPEKLCKTCHNLDFDKYKDNPIEKNVPLENWGVISVMAEKCAFCRLVFQSVKLGREPRTFQKQIVLSNISAWTALATGPGYGLATNEEDLEAHAKQLNSRKGSYRLLVGQEHGEKENFSQIQFCRTETKLPSELATLLGRKVESRINPTFINSWLDRCGDLHESCNGGEGSRGKLPPGMRLIDVKKRNIVLLSSTVSDAADNMMTTSGASIDVESITSNFSITSNDFATQELKSSCRKGYVALSYVWGNRTINKHNGSPWIQPVLLKCHIDKSGSNEGVVSLSSIKETLPQTVEDAMQLTLALGYSYLWVDALCIVQDELLEKKVAQLEAMDAIYSQAALTIAATTNVNSNDGLCGVSSPRTGQIIETVHNHSLATVLPKFGDIINSTELIWNTRAWTLQEKLFPRRLLLFTKSQVYFKCLESIWSEDVDMEIDHLTEISGKFQWPPWNEKKTATRQDLMQKKMFKVPVFEVVLHTEYLDFTRLLGLYTTRHLTEPSDILRAAHGLIMSFAEDRIFCGIPESRFPQGLLWASPFQPMLYNCVNNSLIESWFKMPHGDEIKQHLPSWSWGSFPSPKQWIQRAIRSNWTIVRTMTYIDGKDIKPIKNEYIKETAKVQGIHAYLEDNLSVKQSFEKIPALLIESMTVKLRVGKPIDNFEFNFPKSSEHECTWLEILDANNLCCGQVWTSRHVQKLVGSEPTLFVPLCFSDGDDLAVKVNHAFVPSPEENSESVEVLMVWDDGAIHRRVGLGSIMKKAWINSRPEHQYVFLT